MILDWQNIAQMISDYNIGPNIQLKWYSSVIIIYFKRMKANQHCVSNKYILGVYQKCLISAKWDTIFALQLKLTIKHPSSLNISYKQNHSMCIYYKMAACRCHVQNNGYSYLFSEDNI